MNAHVPNVPENAIQCEDMDLVSRAVSLMFISFDCTFVIYQSLKRRLTLKEKHVLTLTSGR